jgi:Kef-type K+ transport system membrane component KefB
MELAFTNLLIVVAVGFAAPLVLGFFPAVRLPSVVLEIVAGIAVGPALLGWVSVDEPVRVFSTVGLAYLLFLAGLEVDFERLRGRVLRVALVGFVVSLAIAIVVGLLV